MKNLRKKERWIILVKHNKKEKNRVKGKLIEIKYISKIKLKNQGKTH